jgi:hypothetical protein
MMRESWVDHQAFRPGKSDLTLPGRTYLTATWYVSIRCGVLNLADISQRIRRVPPAATRCGHSCNDSVAALLLKRVVVHFPILKNHANRAGSNDSLAPPDRVPRLSFEKRDHPTFDGEVGIFYKNLCRIATLQALTPVV